MPGDKSADKEKVLEADTGPSDPEAQKQAQSVSAPPVNMVSFDITLPTVTITSDVTEISPTEERSLVGESIDQYKIVEVLGKGGMSIVYKAVHMLLHHTVAIKMMHSHLVSEQQAVMRFKQEAQAATHLDHPNIIKVIGFGITGGDTPQPYIIMDYLDGHSLSEALKEKGRLSLTDNLKIFIQIANALSHAHSKGVVHRDLKPSNVMLLDKDGDPNFVKLVDFGIAKVLSQEGEQAHRLTQTGEIFGSPLYMSPEQCMGRPVDKRSDIYSLGCVLYEALSGKPPHQGNSVFETFHRHITEIPAPLSIAQVDKAMVERLDAIVFRALEKEPAKRYQSMSQLENDLSVALESSGVADIRSSFSRKQRWVKRLWHSAPKAVIASVLAFLILASAGAFAWYKCSWFFDSKHDFQTPDTHWLSYLPARYHKRRGMSVSERQKMLDDSMKGLMYASLGSGDASQRMLDMWTRRAKICAELDAVSDEIDARKRIISYFHTLYPSDYINQPEYGPAAEEYGECLIGQGDYWRAFKLLKEAAYQREKLKTSMGGLQSPRVHLDLAYVSCKLHDFQEADLALAVAMTELTNLPAGVAGGGLGMAFDGRQLAICYALKGDAARLRSEDISRHRIARQVSNSAAAKPDQAAVDDLSTQKPNWEKPEQEYATADKVMSNTEYKKASVFLNELNVVRAYVNLKCNNFKEASRLYDIAMPWAQKEFHDQKLQLQAVLDDYAYAAWKSGDWAKAIRLREQSVNLGLAPH